MTNDCNKRRNGNSNRQWLAVFAVGAALAVPRTASAATPGGGKEAPSEIERVASAVEDALQRHAGDVHACMARAVADRLDVSGKIELEVTLGKRHEVVGSRVLSRDDSVTDTLADCVLEASRGWTIADVEPGASIVLPFSLTPILNQFVVKTEDAPNRGPKPRGRRRPPFAVKIVADELNVRARKMSALWVEVAPANRVAMTRHPNSDKIVYVLAGVARILGPKGMDPLRLTPDSVAVVPRGFPHVIENMGRQLPAQMLVVFVGPGPEKVFRDPRDPQAREDFEVVRDRRPKMPEGPKPVAAAARHVSAKQVSASGARGQNGQKGQEGPEGPEGPESGPGDDDDAAAASGVTRKPLLGDGAEAVSPALVELVRFEPREAKGQSRHEDSAVFMYVRGGEGTVTIGKEDIPVAAEQAIHVPAGQPFNLEAGPEGLTVVRMIVPAP